MANANEICRMDTVTLAGRIKAKELSPVEVVTAATRTGAQALRKSDEFGTIEAGKFADLLLLNANPLEDVHNFRKIDQVMLAGDWVDRASLKVK